MQLKKIVPLALAAVITTTAAADAVRLPVQLEQWQNIVQIDFCDSGFRQELLEKYMALICGQFPGSKPEETPEQPEETPEQPEETPEQPEATPEQPDEIPEQPDETPEQPDETPEQPEVAPEQPDETPEQPEETPEQPEQTPEQPEQTPEQPEQTPEQPEETPEQPEQTPEQPEETPEQPEVTPEQPEEAPEQPEQTPEQPEETPEQPEETPEQPQLPEDNRPEQPEQTPDETPEQDNGPSQGDYASQVVALVNAERAKYGLSALKMDSRVQQAAQVRAAETVQSFSHTRPNGSSFSTALTEAGVSYIRSGENIAYGQSTPQQVVQAWMNSTGHRANILNESFTTIGVGYTVSGGTAYWVQLFTA